MSTAPNPLRAAWDRARDPVPEALLEREWLVTNGLGGYASGTLSGACTRRFHGLLVAALPAPHGRVVMLNHLMEEARLADGTVLRLGGEERVDGGFEPDAPKLAEFRLELGLPVWTYELGEAAIEKRVVMPHRTNTVCVLYRLLRAARPVRIRLRPSVHFRPHHGRVDDPLEGAYAIVSLGDRHELRRDPYPPLQIRTVGPRVQFVLDGGTFRRIRYRLEAARGYDSEGSLWSPGYFKTDLFPGGEGLAFMASADPPEGLAELSGAGVLAAEETRRRGLIEAAPPEARQGLGPELVLAADQFLIAPATRPADRARLRAEGSEAVTVVAGYPWFTDWGRDTMISLEGLTLATGRAAEGASLLSTFAHYVKDGLLPNQFPEGTKEGIYNTADATLWFFAAAEAYRRSTGDRSRIRALLPKLREILEAHRRGTRFGIRVDPADGLLTQGEAGYALTWMDAKMGDWVVTPRRGKAVEINALWYNALRLMEAWTQEEGGPGASEFASAAALARASFNRRFWFERGGYLYDVVGGEGGDDSALRPNQLLAISLAHPVLEPSRWEAVLGAVVRELLTPVGLRSLAPGHPAFRPRYDGDLRLRDGAYHQGTVWAWLVGPLVDAWLRVRPDDRAGARKFLEGFAAHLDEGCVGSISEIFDAVPPFTPRGCFAQAWSVAEVLRSWVRTAPAPSGEAPGKP